MNRRKFNTLAGLSTLGMMSAKANYNPLNTPHQYHLNYAPHLGMFKAHAETTLLTNCILWPIKVLNHLKIMR